MALAEQLLDMMVSIFWLGGYKILKHLFCSIAVSLLLCSFVATRSWAIQEPAKVDRQAEIKKALALLDELIAAVQTLKLPENRLWAQVNLADLLWDYDEKRARTLFTEAANSFTVALNNAALDNQHNEIARQVLYQLGSDAVQKIAARDPNLAREFLRATRQLPRADANHHSSALLQLDVSLTAQLASAHPDQALQIAEEILAKGGHYQSVIDILSHIQRKDREVANKLASNIVRRLETENLVTNQEAAEAMLFLLDMGSQDQMLANGGEAQTAAKAERGILNEEALRKLTELAVAVALNASSSNQVNAREQEQERNFVMRLHSLIGVVEKYAPSRLPALRRKAIEFDKAIDARVRLLNEYQGLAQNGSSIEALLGTAVKAPSDLRHHLYEQAALEAVNRGDFTRGQQIAKSELASNPAMLNNFYEQAAWRATNEGDLDQARQFADQVSDSSRREELLAHLERQALWRSAQEKKQDEFQRLLARIRSDEERANILAQLAIKCGEQGNIDFSLHLLDEARRSISNRADTTTQVEAQLQVANAYAIFSPASGFEIIESLTDHLSGLLEAAIRIDGFQPSHLQVARNGESMFQSGSQLTKLLFQHIDTLEKLAPADFGRALSITDRFQRAETRILARLAVIGVVLSGQSGKKDIDKHR